MAPLTSIQAHPASVSAMDDQHGILMDAINELRIAVGRGCGREKASELLDQPIEYMRMHFWSEEQLMEQTRFAELGELRAEHHRMLAEILQAAHRLQYGEGFELRPLLCELHDGLLQHIDRMDQHCGPRPNQRGVSQQAAEKARTKSEFGKGWIGRG